MHGRGRARRYRIRKKPIFLFRVIVDYLLDSADGRAIRDKDLFSIRIDHIEIREFLCCRLDLVHEPLHERGMQPGIGRARVAPFIVGEDGDMRPYPLPNSGNPGIRRAPGLNGGVPGAKPPGRRYVYRTRHDDVFPHVPDRLVGH